MFLEIVIVLTKFVYTCIIVMPSSMFLFFFFAMPYILLTLRLKSWEASCEIGIAWLVAVLNDDQPSFFYNLDY